MKPRHGIRFCEQVTAFQIDAVAGMILCCFSTHCMFHNPACRFAIVWLGLVLVFAAWAFRTSHGVVDVDLWHELSLARETVAGFCSASGFVRLHANHRAYGGS